MSSPNPIPRPPSRSERLLRDTLRKDDTLRTHSPACPRSSSSTCDDDDDDDDFFQSAILLRCSSRRNSAASVLPHGHSTGFYVPDQTENASYSRLLRSSSYSGSCRSARSHRKSSPPAYSWEKQEESSRHHDAAPREAVPRSRLDHVMHSMRIDNDRDTVQPLTHAQSGTASLPSSLGSIANSRTYSHESHQTYLTVPDPDPCATYAHRPKRTSPRHRNTMSADVERAHPTPPWRPSTPPRVAPGSPRSPRSPPGLRSPPQTPTSQEHLKRSHPDSPWLYAPLPPSPPAYMASPSKRGGPAVVAFVTSPVETHTHSVARSPVRHSPSSSTTFDPEAASHALKQLPGYVSFASVAGLGAPPEEDDRRTTRRSFPGFSLGGGMSRLSGLGLGSGKWWMF